MAHHEKPPQITHVQITTMGKAYMDWVDGPDFEDDTMPAFAAGWRAAVKYQKEHFRSIQVRPYDEPGSV